MDESPILIAKRDRYRVITLNRPTRLNALVAPMLQALHRAVSEAVRTRIGGHVVVEALEELGAETAFGLPGVHALGIWEALRESRVRYVGFRTELNAAFAADGYARAGGKPAALLLSTGPGALNSLTGLMEASSAHVPLVAIAASTHSWTRGTPERLAGATVQ